MPDRRNKATIPSVEPVEPRVLMAASPRVHAEIAPKPNSTPTTVLTTDDVRDLLLRAARASASDDAIIAVVDRGGNLLGLRVEGGVSTAITSDPEKLTYAVDGALAEARTGAFFASNAAPLTSRTVQFISQTTMTQREIQSDPNITDPNSTLRGPGFVAPVGIKNHFPPGIQFTPQVDLFAIEHTNRDSIVHPGPDRIKGTVDDVLLPSRFNVPTQYIPTGQGLNPPESYGTISGIDPKSQSRGIGTLPGGIPLYKATRPGGPKKALVGGIGVFFPGTTGQATEENSNLNDAGLYDPKKPDRALEAEWMAFAAAGGSKGAGVPIHAKQLPGVPPLNDFDLPFGRIDLVGITLDIYGGHGLQGIKNLLSVANKVGRGDPNSGTNLKVNTSGATLLPGKLVPEGWLVTPHDGVGITAADVESMVTRGIAEANIVRAAIRLPLDNTARMVFAVADETGAVLGLYRMPDATVFSIDVAVAKARNVAYYANAAELQPIDQITNVPKGVAFTNRTFRYAALPRFPEGIDGYPPGPFSILNDGGVAPNGANSGPPLPASAYQSVQGYDAFNPQTNFHDPFNILNQNGVVFFPGSSPLYKDVNGDGTKTLVGGLGVSGDGVDQDDDVTFNALQGFGPPPSVKRADEVTVRGVRLPYIKFNRQPHEPFDQKPEPLATFHNLPLPNHLRRPR